MAETVPAPAATAPKAKAPKKKSAVKAKKAGPSVGDLIVKAVSASKERSAEESSRRRRLRRGEEELPRQARHQEPGD